MFKSINHNWRQADQRKTNENHLYLSLKHDWANQVFFLVVMSCTQKRAHSHTVYLEASCSVAIVIICGWRTFTSSSGDTRGDSDISREGGHCNSSKDTHMEGFNHSGCCLGLLCLGCSSSEPSSSSCADKEERNHGKVKRGKSNDFQCSSSES